MDACSTTTNGRHAFRPSARPILCEDCGMTRGSVRHSVLGSNRHITTKETRMPATTADLEQARALLAEAREHYQAFAEALQGLGWVIEDIDPNLHDRVDAYPGWTGSRDVGAGLDMRGWLDEIDQALEEKENER